MFEELKTDLKNKMDKVMAILNKDLAGLRTGRVSADFLNSISIEVYGDRTPINQIATVTVQDSNMLIVQVWDGSVVKNVEKAINISDLGVTGSAEGQSIRVPIPPLSEERRKEIVKLASKYGEQSKVSIRNIRRHGIDSIKNMDNISKDDIHRGNDEVQNITDRYIMQIDSSVAEKEKEIMKV